MTVSLWRIASETPKYVADDRTGGGAADSGGRWNEKGTPMLYTSTNIALTVLETLVHLPALPFNRILVRLDVPDEVWDTRITFDASANPGWNVEPAGITSISAGTAWAKSLASVLFAVPSVVVPEELNVLINPLHPDAGKIQIQKVRVWTYDPRLF